MKMDRNDTERPNRPLAQTSSFREARSGSPDYDGGLSDAEARERRGSPDYEDGLTDEDLISAYNDLADRGMVPPGEATAGSARPQNAAERGTGQRRGIKRLGKPTDSARAPKKIRTDADGLAPDREAGDKRPARIGFEDLPPEVVSEIAQNLIAKNLRKTARDLNALKGTSRYLSTAMEQYPALERYRSALNEAGTLAKDMHNRIYPKDGLANIGPDLQQEFDRVGLPISPGDHVSAAAPNLRLLSQSAKSAIVDDILQLTDADGQADAILSVSGNMADLPETDQSDLDNQAITIARAPFLSYARLAAMSALDRAAREMPSSSAADDGNGRELKAEDIRNLFEKLLDDPSKSEHAKVWAAAGIAKENEHRVEDARKALKESVRKRARSERDL
jgi:hypothetical protein